eukprot:c9450_g1_i1 orf=653-838(+)
MLKQIDARQFHCLVIRQLIILEHLCKKLDSLKPQSLETWLSVQILLEQDSEATRNCNICQF